MAETRESSIVKLQKQTLVRKSSVRKDEAEFSERQTDKEWQKSSSATSCTKCQKKFSLTTRKHHCRECGKIYCSKCSAFQVVVNGALKRVNYLIYLSMFLLLIMLYFRLVEYVMKKQCAQMVPPNLLGKHYLLVSEVIESIPIP